VLSALMPQIQRNKVCVTAAEVDAEACGWLEPSLDWTLPEPAAKN